MSLFRRIARHGLPLAGLATAICVLVAVAAQQVYRQSADDPQIQIARDAAGRLAAGAPADEVVPSTPVDFSESPAPFVVVMDEAGAIRASSGRLGGAPRRLPQGVLEHARETGEERVTWQPQRGVRVASVVVHYSGAAAGFVLAGRSLRETERRTAQIQWLAGVAWAATLAGLLALVGVTEWLSGDARSACRAG